MSTVAEVARALARKTRPENAASWDPVGLQLGDMSAEVRTVGVCHEVNEAVVERLESSRVDLLITYHPLLFAPTTRLTAGRSAEARALRLIEMGTNLLVAHTDFDAAPGGAADALAGFLGLRNVEEFRRDQAEGSPPIGRLGDFQGTLGTLDAMVTDAFGHQGLRITGDRDRELGKVAVVPGSGSDFIDEAAALADVLVTGDVSHHRAVRARDLGLAIVDPGHVATERPGMEALVAMVSETASVTHDLTEIDPTTWR